MGTPNKNFYQHSLRIVDEAATGKLSGTMGAYRNPSPLPNGSLLVSYAPTVTALDNFSGKFDIVVVNPETGVRTTLITDGARDCIWPAAVYAKPNFGVFQSRQDEANAATRVQSGNDAKITVLDMGTMQSLLFQNTRSGRRIEPVSSFRVYESLPPEAGVTDYASGGTYVTTDKYGQLYSRRQLLGSVPVQTDSSAGMILPGGVPITLAVRARLEGDTAPADHYQREEMQFYPGEVGKQSFKRQQFNGLCGGCHGSVSGNEMDLAANPDILTSASQVKARDAAHTNLTGGAQTAPQGPPFP